MTGTQGGCLNDVCLFTPRGLWGGVFEILNRVVSGQSKSHEVGGICGASSLDMLSYIRFLP